MAFEDFNYTLNFISGREATVSANDDNSVSLFGERDDDNNVWQLTTLPHEARRLGELLIEKAERVDARKAKERGK